MFKISEDSSYFRDFAAGFEPTGKYTFDSALKNKKNKKWHQAVTAAGGFVGGAALLPSVTFGVMRGFKGLTTPGSLSKRLINAGKGFYRGAKEPIAELVKGQSTIKAIKDAQKGRTLSNKQIKLLDDISNKIPIGAVRGSLPTKADFLHNLRKGKVGLNKETFNNIPSINEVVSNIVKSKSDKLLPEVKSIRNNALVGLGAGGGISSLSAYSQYESGDATARKYNLHGKGVVKNRANALSNKPVKVPNQGTPQVVRNVTRSQIRQPPLPSRNVNVNVRKPVVANP